MSFDSYIDIGEAYIIRCAKYFYVGRVIDINTKEIVLADAKWGLNEGNAFKQVTNNSLELNDMPANTIVSKNNIFDITPLM